MNYLKNILYSAYFLFLIGGNIAFNFVVINISAYLLIPAVIFVALLLYQYDCFIDEIRYKLGKPLSDKPKAHKPNIMPGFRFVLLMFPLVVCWMINLMVYFLGQ